MNKKKLLIILAVIIYIYVLICIRNINIFNKVKKMVDNNLKCENFYYEINGGATLVYRKENISMEIDNLKNIIKWSNKETNEGIKILKDSNEVVIGTADKILPQVDMPSSISRKYNMLEKHFSKCFTSIIKEERIRSVDCYMISNQNDLKVWFDKENGLVKQIDQLGYIYTYENWKLNELTEFDVLKPDISNYKVIEEK